MELKTQLKKSSAVEYPINDLMKRRKSIRAFADKQIEEDKIKSLFEATRWAPSSTNEQPWLYIYATKDQTDLWNKLFDTLNEGNKVWAQDAPLLILSLTRKKFSRYEGSNAHAMYDLGAANAFFSLQAVDLGLQVRQMAGYSLHKAVENLNIPDTYDLGVMMAVGYPGSAENLPENLLLRETQPRERYLQQEFVLNSEF